MDSRPGHRRAVLVLRAAAVALAALFLTGAAVIAVPSACSPTATALCLSNSRFRVEVEWRSTAGAAFSPGQAVAMTGDTGYFWFFQPDNIELVVKVLDGCALGGHYWVFAGGLTNVELDLSVTDTVTGQVRHYPNAQGTAVVPLQDTSAFPCAGAAYDWPQFGFDAAHSGDNPRESIVSRGNVASLGVLFSARLPEVADGAPVLAAAVPTASGTRDLVFFTTSSMLSGWKNQK